MSVPSGRSIFGDRFNDEAFVLSHRSTGWVAMANHGSDTNGSQFYILLTKARWLDGKHVVFGKVIRGMKVVETIGDVPYDSNTAVPRKQVKIIDCGINSGIFSCIKCRASLATKPYEMLLHIVNFTVALP